MHVDRNANDYWPRRAGRLLHHLNEAVEAIEFTLTLLNSGQIANARSRLLKAKQQLRPHLNEIQEQDRLAFADAVERTPI
jgi:hypothetical protein